MKKRHKQATDRGPGGSKSVPEAVLATATVGEWVRKVGYMARGIPDRRVQHDSGLKPDTILTPLDK